MRFHLHKLMVRRPKAVSKAHGEEAEGRLEPSGEHPKAHAAISIRLIVSAKTSTACAPGRKVEPSKIKHGTPSTPEPLACAISRRTRERLSSVLSRPMTEPSSMPHSAAA